MVTGYLLIASGAILMRFQMASWGLLCRMPIIHLDQFKIKRQSPHKKWTLPYILYILTITNSYSMMTIYNILNIERSTDAY